MVPPSTPPKTSLESNGGKVGRAKGSSVSEASSDDEHTSGYVRANLNRASEIEEKLGAVSSAAVNGGPSAEERASKLRFELCELLSDILLTDPNVAASHDVAGRLWKGCFYGRIGELRTRIGRERSRLKKATARGAGSAGNEEELRRMLAELEKSLKVFLGEAVVLYDYLVDKYQAMLIPPPSQSQTQLSQTDSSNKKRGNPKRNNGKPQTPEMSQASHSCPMGVLPTLHRLLIHLGDLHRYANSFNDAEATYLKASKLGPGKGNPYNQLAVVAQLRETQQPLTAVALFWYARALLATSEPFSTSRSNLARLFAVNRQWLDKNVAEGGDSTLALLASSPRDVGSTNNKRAQQEQVRAMKSAASRNFLAKFVDLHWDFARGVRDPNAMSKDIDGQVPQNTIENAASTTTSLLETFATLLQVAAFGDALLCKTVCINAFAVWTAGEFAEEGSDNFLEVTRSLAITFMLGFGTELAKSVENALLKHVSGVSGGSSGGGKPSTLSVRLLLPLLLTADFVSSLIATKPAWIEALSEEKESTPPLCPSLHRKYWESIASLINNIEEAHVLEKKRRDGTEQKAPKEYEAYDGYKPFVHFIQSELEGASSVRGGDGFVSLERAVSNLELPSQTQASQGSSGKVKNSSDSTNATETVQKLNYFVSIAERHVGESGVLVRLDGKLHYREEESADSQTTMPPCPADETMENIEDNSPVEVTVPERKVENLDRTEDNNLVEYKISGSGPKLLVPTSLLIQGASSSSSTTPPPPRSKPNDTEDMVIDKSAAAPVSLVREAPAPASAVGQQFLNPALLTESQVASPIPRPDLRPTIPPSTSPSREPQKLPIKPPPGFFPASSPAPLGSDTLGDARFGLGQASLPQSRTPPPGFGTAFGTPSDSSLPHQPGAVHPDPLTEVLRQQASGGLGLLDQVSVPSPSNFPGAGALEMPSALRTANPFALFESSGTETPGAGLAGSHLTQGIGVSVGNEPSPPLISRRSPLDTPLLSARLDGESGSVLPSALMEGLGEPGSRGSGLGNDAFALNSLFPSGEPSHTNGSLLSAVFLERQDLGQRPGGWDFGRKDNSSQQEAASMTRNPFLAP